MGRYESSADTCVNCGQFVANHSWTEPERKARQTETAYAESRNEAQRERGANHNPQTNCKEFRRKES